MAMKYLVLDTETAGTIDKPRVYDLAWTVTDRNGATYAERRFIIRETWENAGLMGNSYYAEKIPTEYQPLIDAGKLRVVPLQTARLQMLYDMTAYGITSVYAFNADFDRKALDHTIKVLSNGYVGTFLPESVEWRCIMGYAQDIVACTKDYVAWCIQHDYISEAGNPRGSAEILYRYISRDTGFIESHTALEDVRIESEIMYYAMKHHGRKRGTWRCGSRWRKMRAIKDAIKS